MNKDINNNKLTLNRRGSERINFTLIANPINVAILQPGIVGEYSTQTQLSASFTLIQSSVNTLNTSRL
ncbi:unnamed protein product [Schistosoma margrebowiei]|uniref:Uncharacterized protein n=1 Tax=Schistosoma margrebowiei TaxID=48269 RepID=A0A183LSI3_9TREM|nr:unnamed protein product [Schistosoma margrebowiei]